MSEANYSAVALSLLKADLGFYNSALPSDVESHLTNLLKVSHRRLARAGINLVVGEIDDDQLQAMYAAWMYRKRLDGAEKSQALKQEIRDRQVDIALTADEEAEA